MEDKDYLAALRTAFDEGRLTIDMEYGKLDHLDSPVNVQAEKAWWPLGGLFGSLALGWFFDWHYGVAFAAVIAILYYSVGRRIIGSRMRVRLRKEIMEDMLLWRKQWRLKGIALVIGDDRCASPDGNWIRFAMKHLTGEDSAAPQA